MSKAKFIFNNLGIIVGVLVMFSLVAYADSWSAPTANPPGNNVAAPLNVGGSDQVKLGGLGVGPLAVFGDILVSNVYKQGGAGNIKTGISLNCPGQTIGDINISGGIITGGACGSALGSAKTIVQVASYGQLTTATCPAGKKITGGGCNILNNASGNVFANCRLARNGPVVNTNNTWQCQWKHRDNNNDCGEADMMYTYAICE